MAKDEHTDTAIREQQAGVRPSIAAGRWDGVDVLAYKEEGAAPFKSVTRQVLFADHRLGCEWRYFEVAPGGYSTLERHEHVHAVLIHRGSGSCLVGREVCELKTGDLVFIPPMTWHQFRAGADAPLGFLCLVNAERDRPQLPGPDDLAMLAQDPGIARFIRAPGH